MFRMFVIIAFLFFSTSVYAEQSDTSILYDLISRAYIKMRVDDDNKIPKKDRKKWEERLSGFIDFESLNNVMRDGVREALSEHNDAIKRIENIEYFAEKAVSFYLPKLLRSYTHAFLKIQDQLGELPKCEDKPKPNDENKVIICTSRKEKNIIYAYLVAADKPEDKSIYYTFKKTDKWRLTGIYTPIGEGTLKLLGVWK